MSRPPKPEPLRVTSPTFREGGAIPPRHTADGQDLSPALHWSEPPATTRSFAVVCEDPDAPSGLFVHWVAWGIPADRHDVAEGVVHTLDAAGVRQGINGFGKTGFAGPKPPPGKAHRYFFHVYALDDRPDLPVGAGGAELVQAMHGHVVAEGALLGVYGA
jgi:Raf kinase inhibitor-like YbhB/YbcL family protein